MRGLFVLAVAGISLTACGRRQAAGRVPYVPLTEAERVYGALITAGNRPVLNQRGTGERVGLFQDASGTVWGLPLTVLAGGQVLVCAPPLVHYGQITDTFPTGSTIIGSTNEPDGWRSGNGALELLLRDARGNVRWQAVSGAPLATGSVCWAPESPGPPRQFHYYRLVAHGSFAQ